MAKRVKKGFAQYYEQGAGENVRRLGFKALANGSMQVAVCWRGGTVHFDLPACDVETLWATDALEDVPTPGERLRAEVERLRREGDRLQTDAWLDAWEKAAARLGIKPEGE